MSGSFMTTTKRLELTDVYSVYAFRRRSLAVRDTRITIMPLLKTDEQGRPTIDTFIETFAGDGYYLPLIFKGAGPLISVVFRT